MPATTNPPTVAELVHALGIAGGQLDDDQRRVALTPTAALPPAIELRTGPSRRFVVVGFTKTPMNANALDTLSTFWSSC